MVSLFKQLSQVTGHWFQPLGHHGMDVLFVDSQRLSQTLFYELFRNVKDVFKIADDWQNAHKFLKLFGGDAAN